MRLLHWSRDKLLSGAGKPLSNIAVMCLVTLLALLVLAGVDLNGPFRSINNSLLSSAENADIIALGLPVFAVILVFRLL